MFDESLSLEEQWEALLAELETIVGKRPADLNAVLFLIGVQELGMGARRFEKEQKQDLMHIGICTVLSQSGYYEKTSTDIDGWPHFDLKMDVPKGDLTAQENFLKMHVLEYFKNLLIE